MYLYLAHDCEVMLPKGKPVGTLWQCDDCRAVWEYRSMMNWVKVKDAPEYEEASEKLHTVAEKSEEPKGVGVTVWTDYGVHHYPDADDVVTVENNNLEVRQSLPTEKNGNQFVSVVVMTYNATNWDRFAIIVAE